MAWAIFLSAGMYQDSMLVMNVVRFVNTGAFNVGKIHFRIYSYKPDG